MSRTITIPTEGGEFSARHRIDAGVAYNGGDTESYLRETVYSYSGCNHPFARHTGAHYDAKAAAANGPPKHSSASI
jgi:hypothetical protein